MTVGGYAVAVPQVSDQVSEDLARAETLAFPLLFLLSLIVFRGAVAALLPLFVGLLTIMGTFLGLRIVNEGVLLSIFALNLTIGLGLGLAIDYSLFVLSRYREEMERVGAGRDALVRTLKTAGRTVIFSSLTVAVAMLSLLVFPARFLYSMGIAGAITAVVAGTVALTALPALLVLLGDRVNALAPARLRASRGRHRARLLLSPVAVRHAPPGRRRARRPRPCSCWPACRSCASSSPASTRACCPPSRARRSSTPRCARTSRRGRRRRCRSR